MQNELTFLEKQPLSIRLEFTSWYLKNKPELIEYDKYRVFDLWCCYFDMPVVLSSQIAALKPNFTGFLDAKCKPIFIGDTLKKSVKK